MNYIQKTTIFLGMLTAINGNNFIAQAQLRADSSHTALTKARLNQIATNQGLLLEEAPIAFQNFALATIRRSGNLIPENHAPFYSPEREDKTGGSLRNVVPDGVLPLIFQNFPFGSTETYVDSVFYEVKALSGGLLPLSYSRYQILGFLDALSRSDAAGAGKIPVIIFLTTADIRQISSATVSQAVFKGVGVLHAIACEIPGNINNLQLGEASVRNPELYIINLTIPEQIGPGTPGGIFLNLPNQN